MWFNLSFQIDTSLNFVGFNGCIYAKFMLVQWWAPMHIYIYIYIYIYSLN